MSFSAGSSPPRPSSPSERRRGPIEPILGGLTGLALAAYGEALVQGGDRSHLPLLLYLGGIGVFVLSAHELPVAVFERPSAGPAPAGRPEAIRRWLLFGGASLLAIGLALVNLSLLNWELGQPLGVPLWLASAALPLVASLALRPVDGWPARWGAEPGPASPAERWMVLAAMLAIGVLAISARFLLLESVPLGINADEGDRAATSIQILRGTNQRSVFDVGWYHISMVYFWLLAQPLKLFGLGYVQARIFGALASVVSVLVVTWLGVRHFGRRAGLLAGFMLAGLGVSLQFARETTEASPTATLWALSVALLLEAARRGRTWAWIGAGLAGGFSLYFYPSARLWAGLAVVYGLYLLVHGLGGRRLAIARGLVLAALGAALILAPFGLVFGLQRPSLLTVRALETSIFANNNVARLDYVQPEWSTPRLVAEQTVRAVGLLNRFPDAAAFWPTDHPIVPGPLAVLTLLGLGWCALRWWDPRGVALALWFFFGLLGVIVTVETPNLQRLATAVPLLGLLPAITLDNVARRLEAGWSLAATADARLPGRATTWLLALVAVWLTYGQLRFYFVDYAPLERWVVPNWQGAGVRDQGPDTLVLGLHDDFHMTTSGWVRLLALDTPGGGIRAPGSDLPPTLPADHNLAFMIFPRRGYYLPYLSDLFPRGSVQPYVHPKDGLQFTIFRVEQQDWASDQGALLTLGEGQTARVDTFGALPPHFDPHPAPARWTAGLNVPYYWTYRFLSGPGPARLTVNGVELLSIPDGEPPRSAEATLAQGQHFVVYEAAARTGAAAPLRWLAPDDLSDDRAVAWQPIPTQRLSVSQSGPVGLLATSEFGNQLPHLRLDRAVATCCLASQLRAAGRPFTATWRGTLQAPLAGRYRLALATGSPAELTLDGQRVISAPGGTQEPAWGEATLTAGPHPVELTTRVTSGEGSLEWLWTPPGGQPSLVPPSVLTPPPGAGVLPPLPPELLGPREAQPAPLPLYTVR